MLCHSRSSALTLTNVHLNDCRLIVKDEAEAGLEDVEVHHSGNSPAVVVSGRDTNVRATNTTIVADNGSLVEGGASFNGEGVRVEALECWASVQGTRAPVSPCLTRISNARLRMHWALRL